MLVSSSGGLSRPTITGPLLRLRWMQSIWKSPGLPLCLSQGLQPLLAAGSDRKFTLYLLFCTLFLNIKAPRNKYPKTAGCRNAASLPVTGRCLLPTTPPSPATPANPPHPPQHRQTDRQTSEVSECSQNQAILFKIIFILNLDRKP